jgi:hypothetical protein
MISLVLHQYRHRVSCVNICNIPALVKNIKNSRTHSIYRYRTSGTPVSRQAHSSQYRSQARARTSVRLRLSSLLLLWLCYRGRHRHHKRVAPAASPLRGQYCRLTRGSLLIGTLRFNSISHPGSSGTSRRSDAPRTSGGADSS